MATRQVITFTDDMDGSEATETVKFGINDDTYAIDLNAEHAEQLREALRPWVKVARRVRFRGTTSRKETTDGR